MSNDKWRDVPVLILAGGGCGCKGTSKSLIHFGGKSFIAWQLEHLMACGFTKVLIPSTPKLFTLIDRELYANGPRGPAGLKMEWINEPARLMTGGAVLAAVEQWKPRVLVIHGDTWLPEDWHLMLDHHERMKVRATMAEVDQGWTFRYSRHEVHSGMLVKVLNREPGSGAGCSNGGAYVLDHNAFGTFEPGDVFCLEPELFPTMHGRVGAYLCQQKAIRDVGVWESQEAMRHCLTEALT